MTAVLEKHYDNCELVGFVQRKGILTNRVDNYNYYMKLEYKILKVFTTLQVVTGKVTQLSMTTIFTLSLDKVIYRYGFTS